MGQDATQDLGDGELRRRTRRALNGGKISYEMSRNQGQPPARSTEWVVRLEGKGWGRLILKWKRSLWTFIAMLFLGVAVVIMMLSWLSR